MGTGSQLLASVTDEHFELLMHVRFETLNLRETEITDATCVNIASSSPGILALYLDNTSLGDVGLSELYKLNNLGYMYLKNTDVLAEKGGEFQRLRPRCEVAC